MKGTALITGGSLRLGRHIALHLAGQGKNIALHYNSSKAEAEAACLKLKHTGVQCHLFQADFSLWENQAEPERLIKEVLERFPDLDMLVNNASYYQQASLMETSPQLWEQAMQINLRAPLFLMRSFAAAAQGSADSNIDRHIINILDNKIAFHQYHYFVYLLSKQGLATATRLAAAELAPLIRVNGIAPGVVLPASSRSSDYLAWRIEGIPLRRQGQPAAILSALDYLLKNDFATGQILTVDGGESLGSSGRSAANYPPGQADREATEQVDALPSAGAPESPDRTAVGSHSGEPHSRERQGEGLHSYVIAVGSNIEPHKNIPLALEILQKEQELLGKSTFIRTKPVGLQEQPDFLNGALYVRTPLDPDQFRAYLKMVEKRLKRVKGALKSSPRTIDLDIIIHNSKIVDKSFYQAHYVREPVCEVVEHYEISL